MAWSHSSKFHRFVSCGHRCLNHNKGFTDLCGFAREDVLGSNCRFLQGPDTEPSVVASMKECMRTRRDCHVRITNYRKDGSTFLNLLSLLESDFAAADPPQAESDA